MSLRVIINYTLYWNDVIFFLYTYRKNDMGLAQVFKNSRLFLCNIESCFVYQTFSCLFFSGLFYLFIIFCIIFCFIGGWRLNTTAWKYIQLKYYFGIIFVPSLYRERLAIFDDRGGVFWCNEGVFKLFSYTYFHIICSLLYVNNKWQFFFNAGISAVKLSEY